MKIVSVNVGMPREVVWKGMTVQAGIFTEPLDGAMMIREMNLAGDQQADLTVHGGAQKAVYGYPAEHYLYWRASYETWHSPGGISPKTLQPKGFWKTLFVSGTV